MSSDNPDPPVPHPPPDSDPNLVPRPISPVHVTLLGRAEAASRQFVPTPPPLRRITRPRRALVLFLLTCLSTFLVGFYDGHPVFPHWDYIRALSKPEFGSLWVHFQN